MAPQPDHAPLPLVRSSPTTHLRKASIWRQRQWPLAPCTPPSPTPTASSGRVARAWAAGEDEQGEGCRRCRVPSSASLQWQAKLRDLRFAARSSDGSADWSTATTSAPLPCPTWPHLLPGQARQSEVGAKRSPDGGTSGQSGGGLKFSDAGFARARPAPPPRHRPIWGGGEGYTSPELLLQSCSPWRHRSSCSPPHGFGGAQSSRRSGARTSRPARRAARTSRPGGARGRGAVGLLTWMNERREEDGGNLVQNF
jgi:hypothetical protein